MTVKIALSEQINGSLVGIVGTRAQPSDGDFRLQLLEDFILGHVKNSFTLDFPFARMFQV